MCLCRMSGINYTFTGYSEDSGWPAYARAAGPLRRRTETHPRNISRYPPIPTLIPSELVLTEYTHSRYIIYSLDWNDEKTMLETLGPNYQQQVGACLSDYYSVLNQ